jgi:hypothetical protein
MCFYLRKNTFLSDPKLLNSSVCTVALTIITLTDTLSTHCKEAHYSHTTVAQQPLLHVEYMVKVTGWKLFP